MNRDNGWTCSNCGSTDPHDAFVFPKDSEAADFEDGKVEIDVTCKSVYITPAGDDLNGFAFTHDEFREIIWHFEESEMVE